jgi:peptidoglycan hydrolase-like protein with peptidoglycan-binding domain
VHAETNVISNFSHSFSLHSSGPQVRNLQRFLNANGFMIATKGPGSLGNETDYYGQKTANAVKAFQKTYSKSIKPSSVTKATGVFTNDTLAFINKAIETNNSGKVLGIAVSDGFRLYGSVLGASTDIPNNK